MKNIKKPFILLITIVFVLINASCFPSNIKEYKLDRNYPDDIVPVYDDAIIYDYENNEDQEHEVYAGTKDTVSDVAEFYSDFFDDEDIKLDSEKRSSSLYTAKGLFGGWMFEVIVAKPSTTSDKRLYNAMIEIYAVSTAAGAKVDAPVNVNSDTEDILQAMQDDLQIIDNLVKDSGSSDDMSLDEMLIMFADYQSQIEDRINEIKQRQLNETQLIYLQNSEIVHFGILADTLNELELMCYYALDLLEVSVNMENEMQGVDVTNEYDMYYAVEAALSNAVMDLNAVEVPSFLQYKHERFVEKLAEFELIAMDYIWAYSMNDNLRMSSYNYFLDYYLLAFEDFVESSNDDLNTRMTKYEEDIDYIKTWVSDFDYFITNTLNTGTLDLALYGQEYLSIADEINVSYAYDVPDELVPANYRSMEYLVFIELWTNRDSKDVMVTVEIPEYTHQYKQLITINRAETELAVLPPLVSGITEKLNTSKDSHVEITIEDADTGEIILQATEPIYLNSIYDMRWGENGRLYYENILAWVTPENDMILQLQRNAADSVEDMTNGYIDGIWGYQGEGGAYTEAQITYYQTAAIMHAMADAMEVKYINSSFSTTDSSIQRIATPQRVLENSSGLCIETAVTLASALQASRMNSMIILLPGHAQVAVETWDYSGEYFLIETTALTSAKNQNFDYVIGYYTQDEWRNYIEQNYVVAIDCTMATALGIHPIE